MWRFRYAAERRGDVRARESEPMWWPRPDPRVRCRTWSALVLRATRSVCRSGGPPPPPDERTRRGERGQALPLVLLTVMLTGGALVTLGRFGAEAVSSARARTAADAAALAGAVDGKAAAREVALANGGRLVSYTEVAADVRVVVELGGHRESARARSEGSYASAGGRGRAGVAGLAPALRAAIARAEQLLGRPIPIVSGYRSPEQQRRLWENRHNNPYPVAPPGSSMHERGLAIDVPRAIVEDLLTVGRAAGLCQPYPRTDPIHFELCR